MGSRLRSSLLEENRPESLQVIPGVPWLSVAVDKPRETGLLAFVPRDGTGCIVFNSNTLDYKVKKKSMHPQRCICFIHLDFTRLVLM